MPKQNNELSEFVGSTLSQIPSDMAEKVSVLSNDGRILVGNLKGCDNLTNIILTAAVERIFGEDGVETVELGLYIIRGDSMYVFIRCEKC